VGVEVDGRDGVEIAERSVKESVTQGELLEV
jgi:hypothetical protein